MKNTAVFLLVILMGFQSPSEEDTWVRINFLGYKPGGTKVAVWVTKKEHSIKSFALVDARSGKTVFTASAGNPFGAYGPFVQSFRLDFSSFSKNGRYRIVAGTATSPEFEIGEEVYKGTADFCLRYMRQQRSGFNPFFKDSCHTQDGYSLYGGRAGLKDSTHIDVSGGWHDATDYLQYSSTSANATFQMLIAWRDFPQVFGDKYAANGLEGGNGRADILDEVRWGLDWLLKMHPRPDWMFNQLADDRDHAGMRLPKMDSFYNKGYERPVYFVTGEPQQRGKFMNTTTGTSSIAGKFCSAFSMGALLLRSEDPVYADSLRSRAHSALAFSLKRPGYTQTASVKAPYIYGERNWVDDMELAYAAINRLQARNGDQLVRAINYARQERTTPWMGRDTADHYEWYPFVNAGHYELASQLTGKERELIIGFMKEGIELVWAKARENAFFRGVPFIWCSNNLTTAFAMQCYWYRKLTGDSSYEKLEQACFDWLFGCNPWGTSMVYGLPSGADTPIDPHSSLTHLNNYPIDGGLVDGPIYTRTFNSLLGLHLSKPDTYAPFQSDLAVYHDDYGDYSTNEPTMDGTATLIYLLAAKEAEHARPKK